MSLERYKAIPKEGMNRFDLQKRAPLSRQDAGYGKKVEERIYSAGSGGIDWRSLSELNFLSLTPRYTTPMVDPGDCPVRVLICGYVTETTDLNRLSSGKRLEQLERTEAVELLERRFLFDRVLQTDLHHC